MVIECKQMRLKIIRNEFLFNLKDSLVASGMDRIMVGSFDAQGSFSTVPFSNYLQATDCLTPTPGALSIPHSGTFTDLDGDCMPDLFLTRTYVSKVD